MNLSIFSINFFLISNNSQLHYFHKKSLKLLSKSKSLIKKSFFFRYRGPDPVSPVAVVTIGPRPFRLTSPSPIITSSRPSSDHDGNPIFLDHRNNKENLLLTKSRNRYKNLYRTSPYKTSVVIEANVDSASNDVGANPSSYLLDEPDQNQLDTQTNFVRLTPRAAYR